MELFRREALDGQDRLHGDIVFVPQISWRLLGLFFAAAFAIAAFFLFTAQYRPAIPVSGRLAEKHGALVASFEVDASATEGLAAGHRLRLAAPGIARRMDAQVSALAPAARGSVIVHATLASAATPLLRPGMAVRTAFPSRPRTLASQLSDAMSRKLRP